MARVFPRFVFGNKRLEGILARLDDDKIDAQLVHNLDEGQPQMLLDYLLEANRVHSLSAFLSDDDNFLLLKYFNDFLARNYQSGTFQRLKELKIYKPVWSDKYINLNFTGSSLASPTNNNSTTTPQQQQQQQPGVVPNVYLVSEEMANVMRRAFKNNPFVPKPAAPPPSTNVGEHSTSAAAINSSPFIIIVRRAELAKLYAHLNLLSLNDLESFLYLCLPQMRKLEARVQANLLKHLYDDILDKCFAHDRDKCFKILRERLFIQNRLGEQRLISHLYDAGASSSGEDAATLRSILGDAHFADELFDSAPCRRFLRDAGMRTHLPCELLKSAMSDLERDVTAPAAPGWTDELRARSRALYSHMVRHWSKMDESVLQQRFLEPHAPPEAFVSLLAPFEHAEFAHTCLKLADAELCTHQYLCWSSSFVLPAFVDSSALEADARTFFKLERKRPCLAIVQQHLANVCEAVKTASGGGVDEATLFHALTGIYGYLDELSGEECTGSSGSGNDNNEGARDMCKQLEDKEIVWSARARKFVTPARLCVELPASDEIAPFLFALAPQFARFAALFVRLGAKRRPYAMLYADILRKMAKVCGDDYLNSNELCKALKAMECFFRYLKAQPANTTRHTSASTTGGKNLLFFSLKKIHPKRGKSNRSEHEKLFQLT